MAVPIAKQKNAHTHTHTQKKKGEQAQRKPGLKKKVIPPPSIAERHGRI